MIAEYKRLLEARIPGPRDMALTWQDFRNESVRARSRPSYVRVQAAHWTVH